MTNLAEHIEDYLQHKVAEFTASDRLSTAVHDAGRRAARDVNPTTLAREIRDEIAQAVNWWQRDDYEVDDQSVMLAFVTSHLIPVIYKPSTGEVLEVGSTDTSQYLENGYARPRLSRSTYDLIRDF